MKALVDLQSPHFQSKEYNNWRKLKEMLPDVYVLDGNFEKGSYVNHGYNVGSQRKWETAFTRSKGVRGNARTAPQAVNSVVA